jgi:hypothetical protein
MASSICVAHLVRAKNGMEPLQRFLESYARNQGGIEHDLLLIFKGFQQKKLPDQYRQLLGRYPHQALFVDDKGYDIVPYFIAASRFNYRHFCFLNSFSVILDEQWLRKMYSHITGPGIGLVGATGSYQSTYTDLLKSLKIQSPQLWRRVVGTVLLPMLILKCRIDFYSYPNYHIRTNAFMIAGDLMRKIKVGSIRHKWDCYTFESGKKGLTHQILRKNLRALVVGKNGRAYEKEEWVNSFSFWQGDQANLLVADNQTNAYTNADLQTKWKYARHAWADRANPLAVFDDGSQMEFKEHRCV